MQNIGHSREHSWSQKEIQYFHFLWRRATV